MKDIIKILAHDLFQRIIVFSVFLILLFYWPNHDVRLMKFICFQTVITLILTFSFIFTPKRTIDNFWPTLLLIYGFINLFTHNMSDTVNVGVSFIFYSVIGIYVISNHLHSDNITAVKKAIIITCLVNCALFVTQLMGIDVIFKLGQHERACGFMCYPASFALLCAISIIICWFYDMKHMTKYPLRWLIIPIGACLIMSKEYSVILGLTLAISMPFWRAYWRFLIPLMVLGISFFIWKDYPVIYQKASLRMRYIYPVFQNVWARPIDGWGVGEYNRLPESFFGFERGNWSEMHCEPLDTLFCLGLVGFSIAIGWLNSLRRLDMKYKMIFVVIGITSFFHSPFHFADSLFLSIITFCLAEIEYYEQSNRFAENIVRKT